MSVFTGTVFSQSLGMMTDMTVSVPTNLNTPAIQEFGIPVLYLLHGLSDNHSAWLRRTNVDRYADEAGIAVVMPEVQRSFYADMAYGLRYFTYITEELPELCRQMFRFSARVEDTYIAGLSMGGYGAMKAALNCPQSYAAAGCFSAALDFAECTDPQFTLLNEQEVNAIRGGSLAPENDLFSLANRAAEQSRLLPRLYISCGKSDFIYHQSLKMHGHLTSLEITHTYEEWDGTHDWTFWDTSIQRFFEFIRK